jgi:hypothetical protein
VRDAAAAQAEAAEVQAHDVAVARAVERAGLDRMLYATLERLEREGAGRRVLEAEVSRLLTAAKGGHVIEVSHGDTGWISTGGPPAGGAPEAGGGPGVPSLSASPPARECLLAAGDEGRIQTDQVRARYAHGTVGVVGTADAFGRAPGGEPRHLFGGPLRLEVAVEGAPRAPGWAWGAGGGISGRGTLGAVLVQTPPAELPLVHWPVRGWLLGAGGANQGLILGGVSIEP